MQHPLCSSSKLKRFANLLPVGFGWCPHCKGLTKYNLKTWAFGSSQHWKEKTDGTDCQGHAGDQNLAGQRIGWSGIHRKDELGPFAAAQKELWIRLPYWGCGWVWRHCQEAGWIEPLATGYPYSVVGMCTCASVACLNIQMYLLYHYVVLGYLCHRVLVRLCVSLWRGLQDRAVSSQGSPI